MAGRGEPFRSRVSQGFGEKSSNPDSDGKKLAGAKILCLTFTKAAAANMATRVFDTLALWTRLDDAALRAAIVAVGEPDPSARDRIEARRLFARTVETPGGLRSRPSTPSAKGCCMSFPSRPMRRRALKSPTRWRRPNFWSARAAMF